MSQPDVVLDIVDQMRELSATCGYHGSKKILDGGAAEIERLRAQVRELMDRPRDDGTAIAVGGEPGASAGKSE